MPTTLPWGARTFLPRRMSPAVARGPSARELTNDAPARKRALRAGATHEELVERIRNDEQLKTIPVVAISAGGQDAKDKAVRAGVDVFLRKPVKFAEVLETVKQLLRIR